MEDGEMSPFAFPVLLKSIDENGQRLEQHTGMTYRQYLIAQLLTGKAGCIPSPKAMTYSEAMAYSELRQEVEAYAVNVVASAIAIADLTIEKLSEKNKS